VLPDDERCRVVALPEPACRGLSSGGSIFSPRRTGPSKRSGRRRSVLDFDGTDSREFALHVSAGGANTNPVQEPDVISCPSRKGLPRWTQCHASQATERQNSCGAGQWIEVRRVLFQNATGEPPQGGTFCRSAPTCFRARYDRRKSFRYLRSVTSVTWRAPGLVSRPLRKGVCGSRSSDQGGGTRRSGGSAGAGSVSSSARFACCTLRDRKVPPGRFGSGGSRT
jgi:hypothetical protein